MAGAGFKTFNTGDVLTASDVNTYLMQQTTMVFANASARSTALGANVAEGMISYLKDTNATEVYDGSSWVGIGNSGDITAVTAGTGISGGGTSGDVTITNSMATAIDAKGDLVVGTGADTFSRLAVGSNNQVLTADSSTATGLKWATASSGGSPASAGARVSTYETTTSTSYTGLTTALSVTLTTGTKALVSIGADINSNGAETQATMSFSVSGATTLAASDEYDINLFTTTTSNRPKIGAGRTVLITGLTAGSNTFTTQYKSSTTGSSAGFQNRSIAVVDMGS